MGGLQRFRRRREDRLGPSDAEPGDPADEAPVEPVPSPDEPVDQPEDEQEDEPEPSAVDDSADAPDDAPDDATGDDDTDLAPVIVGDGRRRRERGGGVVALAQAAHPRQAAIVAVGVGVGALAAGREAREVAVVTLAVLVGQVILGWHNDIVDAERDADHGTPRKPVADGRLDAGSVWFAISIGVLLVIPLSLTTGIVAGLFHLGSVLVGMGGNLALRNGRLSFVTWAVQFACYPAYLSFGGWGGADLGDPPSWPMVVLAALLGIGFHFVRSTWGLVADDADGWHTLPLRIGRRLGATRLVLVSGAFTLAVLVGMLIVGSTVGLTT